MKTPQTTPWRAVVASISLLTALNASAFLPPKLEPLPNFDKRAVARGHRAADEKHDSVNRLRAMVPKAKVDFDEHLGTPSWIVAGDEFLSGEKGKGRGISAKTAADFPDNELHRPTKAFLKEHQVLFGHGPEILTGAKVKREFVTEHNGLKTVVWEQALDGISVFEGLLVSHTTKKGELVNISSRFIPDPVQAAQNGAPQRDVLQIGPNVSAAQAIVFAAKNLGENLEAGNVTETDAVSGPEKKQHFRAEALNGEAEARLVWLPMDSRMMVLCWEIILTSGTRGEMYRVLIDARSGDALVRQALTEYISDATYNVYTSDSPSPFSPGHPTPLTTQPPLISRTLVTWSALDTNASPNGWINDGGNETVGNNVDAHLDRDNNNSPDLPRPQGSPFRTFDYPVDLALAPSAYTNAVVTDLFYWCNWIHDRLYQLGFTEAAGNFQTTNFNRGGLGNDALQADGQDGSGVDNANMSTPTDGSAPRMQMYIFTGPTPDRDGDLDHEIVIHEYVHGLSNRRVGGGGGLSAMQSRGMGEGWSDWYGLTLLSEAGDDLNGNYAAGGYATLSFGGLTQNYYYGIRRYPYSTDMTKNPLTFKDIDPAQASTHAGVPRSSVIGNTANEVHNMGEVWCAVLWEARANLIAKHGFATGNEMILRLVTDGMNLSPANPNFLQARDGILQADVVSNGGANQGELWAAFAKRGMGSNATSPSSSTTTGLVESYDLPDNFSITPQSGLTSSGPVGGPFNPGAKNFTLVNIGTNTLNWSGAATASWLTLSQTGGVLTSGATNTLSVLINSSANSLPEGIYNGTIRLTNSTSGVVQTRAFVLQVGQPEYFTELFDGGDNDLDNQTLTFTPDGSANFYSVCREPAAGFPTDPAGGTSVSLSDDSFATVTLAGTNRVRIYGSSNNVFYIGSNGYITLGSGDSNLDGSLFTHFNRPRVSGLFYDLYPSAGQVTWKQMSNRVAITFSNVREYGSVNTNSFQIEMFGDGRIRLTHLALTTIGGLVGLSAGNGMPAGFLESDLSGYGPCKPPITINVPAQATEGDGTLVGQGQINILSPAATNVTVNLSSSDATEVTVPASVIILAGQTTTNFDVTILDDAQLDGTQSATITASGPGYVSANDTLQVLDNETATLSLKIPATAAEGSAPVQGIVISSATPSAGITINLSSSDTTDLQVPASVILNAGQTSAVFNITIVNDIQIEALQIIAVGAQVPGWTAATTNITVQDNESTNLVVSLPATAREGNGTLIGGGQVRIFGTLMTNFAVSLLSDDISELTVPSSVTILAGQTNALFNLTIIDDVEIDGPQNVGVIASASGFSNGGTNMVINDNETPPIPTGPSPAHLATNVIQTADLVWQSGAAPGEVITNAVYFGTNPNPGAGELIGTTTSSNWALPNLLPLTTYYWQIVASKAAPVPGPIWQFTTRGADRFVWDAIASPQFVNQPISTTITAKDIFENTVSNFSGTVNLSASGPGALTTNAILGNVVHSTTFNGTWTIGYSFTPNTNLTVTHVRSYSGTKVSIWTDAGVLLAAQNVSGSAGTWTETLLPTPVVLSAGATYRVGFYTGPNGPYYFRTDGPGTFPHGAIHQGYDASSDNFPTTTDSLRWGLVDLRYTVGSSSTIPITPVVSGAFSNGVWSGNVTSPAPTTNITLRADDGNGHVGVSGPFTVELQNDISLTITDSPDPVSLGGNVSYLITVTNIGPDSANDVVVTNVLPATALLVSVTNSQGTASVVSNTVICNLNTVAANSSATITIVATATNLSNLTNQAFVARSDADSYLSNNAAIAVTAVQMPTITINDANVFEGNSGTANATFTVSVSPPPASAVSVNFATANGTAVSPGDFSSTNGVLNFAVGETNKTITVRIQGDAAYEADETFPVNLSGAINATLADSQGNGTIRNDDAIPTLSISDVFMNEGNGGSNTAVFSITLSAASGLGASFSYVTVSGNASSGTDYVAKSGSLTIAAGVTNTNISVVVLGDLTIEPDEVFYVDLSSAANATLLKREGIGLIVNDDGLPGFLDHFVWSAIAPTQYVGQPFGVIISAQDAFNNPATNFVGPANLDAIGGTGSATNTILPSPIYNNTSSGNFTLGYSFTPTNTLTVTHVRSCFGTKVSIWTDAGTLLASQPVNGTLGIWTETTLATPITLNAGSTYRIGAYTGGGSYYWRTDGSNTFPNGAMALSYETTGDAFPTLSDSVHWWFVDLRYTVGAVGTIPITPTVTGVFANGEWSGNVAILAPATNLILRAADTNGHSGNSSSITAILQNDIALSMTDSPDPVAAGGNVNYLLTVTNIGPGAATSVVVSNLLPASASLVSVTSSQGTTNVNGSFVICNLGTLAANAAATITIVAKTSSAGFITNSATVSRGEADSLLNNNSASAITTVQLPALSINNASVTEGNSGSTQMVFTVSLSLPSPTNVAVNFTTANGSAIAGNDYAATNGTLNFAIGQTNRTFAVLVFGDTDTEANETFSVTLSGPVNATIATNAATGTVLNDEGTGIVAYFSDNNPSATGWSGPITNAGFIPYRIADIAAFGLTNLDVLVIDEVSNGAATAALQAKLPTIQTWVSNGGKLVIHDRGTGLVNPNPLLLGTTGITSTRFTTADIDVVPPGTNLVVAGPRGTINNTTLDGGNSSAHGYVSQIQLPPGARSIISMGGSVSNVVSFSYPLGSGLVYYSSIPMDFYFGSSGNPAIAFQNIYAPNVLAYVSQQIAGGTPPSIVTQPTNQTVVLNGTATFAVTANGSQPLNYQWRKQGATISGATNQFYSINNVAVGHGGNYDVVVANSYGSVTSSIAMLTVVTNLSVTIDFDDLAAPCNFASTARLTNRYAALGVIFDGPTPLNGGAVLDECGSFGVTGHSSPNFLAFNNAVAFPSGGTATGPETLNFSGMISSFQIRIGSSLAGVGTLLAYNTNNQVVASNSVAISPAMQTLSATASNISRVVISCTAQYYVLDDLVFQPAATAPPPQLQFQSMGISNGILTLAIATEDGSPLTPQRAANISIYMTTDLNTPWTWLDVTTVLTNGMLRINGLYPTNGPARFFRAMESQ